MTRVEVVLFWMAVTLYLIGGIGSILGYVFRKERLVSWMTVPALAGLLCHSAAIAVRWAATGHMPMMRDYEKCLLRAWIVVAAYAVVIWRVRGLRILGAIVLPFAVLLLGYGIMKNPELELLSPGHKSPWLYMHVITAWLAFGSFTIASAIAVFYLLKSRWIVSRRDQNGLYSRLPDLPFLDIMSARFVLFGFVVAAMMIISGSIWARNLWGHYWGWDPIETWSLVSWLTYAAVLHMRFAFRWRGKKAAWLTILAFAGVIMAFFGVNYLPVTSHVLNKLI